MTLQESLAEAVESGNSYLCIADVNQLIYALLDFFRGLIVESQSQNFLRFSEFVLNEIANFLGNNGGLARPRAGHNQKRTIGIFHSLTLSLV